jgi:hypothetical protein
MDLPLRCPSCNALVVDRRSAVCTTCRKALPADWVMSPQQKAKMAALERQARLHHIEGSFKIIISLLIATLSIIGISFSTNAKGVTPDKYATKYYRAWAKPLPSGDDSGGFMLASFSRDVPQSLQEEVLDKMLDQACAANPRNYRVITFVFTYVEVQFPDFVLNPRFERDVYTLTKDANELARRDAIEFLGRIHRAGDHDRLVAALNDPSEEVRGAAINALRGQPDAEATFRKFVQDHQNDPAYHTSLMYAKSGLEAIHGGTANSAK